MDNKKVAFAFVAGLFLGGILTVLAVDKSLPIVLITQIVDSYQNLRQIFSISGNKLILQYPSTLQVNNLQANNISLNILCLNGSCITEWSNTQGLWESYKEGIKPKEDKKVYITGGINITLDNIELLSTKKDYVEIVIEGNNPTCPADCQELERYWLPKTCGSPGQTCCSKCQCDGVCAEYNITTSCTTPSGWSSSPLTCKYISTWSCDCGTCCKEETCYADSWSKVKCKCPIYYIQIYNLTVNGTFCLNGECRNSWPNSINVGFYWFIPPNENRTYCTTYNGQQVCEIQFSLCKALKGEGGTIEGKKSNGSYYTCNDVLWGIDINGDGKIDYTIEDLGYNINDLEDTDGDGLKEIGGGIVIYNPNFNDLLDYQVRIDLTNLSSYLQSINYQFKLIDENGNELPYCFEQPNGECNTTPSNVIWVKVNLTANSNTTIYLIPDNKNNAVNGDKIFDFYDDFSELDLSIWTDPGSNSYRGWTIENNYLVLYVGTRGKYKVWTVGEVTSTINEYSLNNKIFEARVRMEEGGSTYECTNGILGIGLTSDSEEWYWGKDIFCNCNFKVLKDSSTLMCKPSWDGSLTDWGIWGIAIHSGTIEFYYNGILQYSTYSTTASNYDWKLKLVCFVNNARGDGWGETHIDWVRVRKYADQEPQIVSVISSSAILTDKIFYSKTNEMVEVAP